jgi:hypothetical protein
MTRRSVVCIRACPTPVCDLYPYAIRSLNAASADGLSVTCVNCVTSSQIQSVPAEIEKQRNAVDGLKKSFAWTIRTRIFADRRESPESHAARSTHSNLAYPTARRAQSHVRVGCDLPESLIISGHGLT